MSRTGLFQRLRQRIGGPKDVELPVSCYGKLPIYKDFLRENLAGKDAQAFKKWLDRGISHYWGEREGYRGETIYPHGFLVRSSDTSSYTIGYLWGSHDEGGLRSFPFCLFVSLPAGRESFPPHSILEVVDAAMIAGRQWRQDAARLATFQDFTRWSRGLRLKTTIRPENEVASEVLSASEDMTIGDFIAGLWNEDADLEWPALLSYLHRYRGRVAAGGHASDLAARFPTSDRLPMILQAQIWSLLIERFDDRRERPVQFLVPAYDDRAGITVVLRELRPDDVFAFHPEMPSNEHIEDFRTAIPRSGESIDRSTDDEKQRPLRGLLDVDFSGE
jgi:type VI secretion system ImpM family protein